MRRYPDVRAVERRRAVEHDRPSTSEGVTIAEPLVLEIDAEPATEGYIEIRDASSDDRVVTVLEVLSPANKSSGEGRRQYQRKQKEVQRAGVSLVEIDLSRAGNWTMLVGEDRIPNSLRAPYRICVWRAWRPLAIEFYHALLRQRLPAIRVPLRDKDVDVVLDVQALIDRAYRMGRYATTDYSVAPNPALEAADADWADALLREQGKRPATERRP